ncbi:NAD(P)/FAD-dependent oxidoreductase [Hoeflea sp. TYP-13]|uniref:NAD(P)/FAD-dependent oxidoreductase n=1 Tax=Hoeflea sp. TYP-13 TaxID=3230023 RepID=UPI0034C62927
MTPQINAPHSPKDDDLSCDLLVVGAGAVGLWIARLAAKAGQSVIVLEKRSVGTGASGGLLGALMPHMPERWNPKKQFQFEALSRLGDEVASLEAETGLGCGYRRCGRLMPLIRPHHAQLGVERKVDAEKVWNSAKTGFEWTLLDAPYKKDWPSSAAMPHGLVLETLAARVSPRRYIGALKASLGQQVTIIESDGLSRFEEDSGKAVTDLGRTITADHTILAAGHETFTLLGDLLARPATQFGAAIKGQAALLRADIDDDLPLVFQDGVYIVPHEGGAVAIGSTSEAEFASGSETDEKLENLIARARELCPELENATVLERWAGLRPKAIKRDPMIGAVPGHQRLTVATGGFKITFGIAHKMAACALELATDGRCNSLPDSFRIETHLR